VAVGLWAASVSSVGLGAYLRTVSVAPADVDAGPTVAFFVGMLVFATPGALVAAHRPGNPIGWLMLAEGLSWQLFGLAGVYRVTALPGGSWAALVYDWGYVVPVALMSLLLLLFPDGRMPSRRWRPLAASLVTGACLLSAALLLRPGPLPSTPVANPLGVAGAEPVLGALEAAGNLAMLLSGIGCAVALVFRYRRAGDIERHQLKWLAYGGVVVLLAWVLAFVLDVAGLGIDTGEIRVPVLLVLPIAIAIAVLQYRLYAIDVIISRTIVYTALAGLIAATYVAIVVGLGSALGAGRQPNLALSVLATVVVAIAFDPARRRLRRVANRLVYGRRATPYEVLAAFTERVSAVYQPGEVLPQMARLIAEASGAAWAEVWLCLGSELRPAGRWPAPHHSAARSVRLTGQTLVHPDADRVYPIVHKGQLLGAMAIAKRPGEQFSPAEDKLLADLASAAGLALENVALVDELKASRQRLVTAQDQERRRVERDLHDGAQQRLLELALTLGIAHQHARHAGADEAAAVLDTATGQARVALAELRDLARGIHPAILVDRGLGPALESLAERAPIPVVVSMSSERRLPETVEATAYFVVSEALANAAKHARADRVDVLVSTMDDRVVVEIVDDGVGAADVNGNGLRGLSDRVAAVDGRFEVLSPPGGGTRVAAAIPFTTCG
jgi:signal transduction histidine kinase